VIGGGGGNVGCLFFPLFLEGRVARRLDPPPFSSYVCRCARKNKSGSLVRNRHVADLFFPFSFLTPPPLSPRARATEVVVEEPARVNPNPSVSRVLLFPLSLSGSREGGMKIMINMNFALPPLWKLSFFPFFPSFLAKDQGGGEGKRRKEERKEKKGEAEEEQGKGETVGAWPFAGWRKRVFFFFFFLGGTREEARKG